MKKFKLKSGKEVSDLPIYSKVFKVIKAEISMNKVVELDELPQELNDLLEEVKSKSKDKGDK